MLNIPIQRTSTHILLILPQQYVLVRHSSVYRRFFLWYPMLTTTVYYGIQYTYFLFLRATSTPIFLVRWPYSSSSSTKSAVSRRLSLFCTYCCMYVSVRAVWDGAFKTFINTIAANLLFFIWKKKETDANYCCINATSDTEYYKKKLFYTYPRCLSLTSTPLTSTVRTYCYLHY